MILMIWMMLLIDLHNRNSLLFFFFQKLYPFNFVNKPNNYIAAAAGGCILTRSKIFRKQDLLEKIKDKVIDDCNLARLIKKRGKIWIGLTNCVKSEREYKKLGEKLVGQISQPTSPEPTRFSALGVSILFQLIELKIENSASRPLGAVWLSF